MSNLHEFPTQELCRMYRIRIVLLARAMQYETEMVSSFEAAVDKIAAEIRRRTVQ